VLVFAVFTNIACLEKKRTVCTHHGDDEGRRVRIYLVRTRFSGEFEIQTSGTISTASIRHIPTFSVTIFEAGQGQMLCRVWRPLTPEISGTGWEMEAVENEESLSRGSSKPKETQEGT